MYNMNGKIHCDHIIACNNFNLLLESEQRLCFHYTNLQPLWAIDNLKKSDNLPEGFMMFKERINYE